jgi:hypothetical protein
MSHLLVYFRELAQGKEGKGRLVNTIKLGVKWLYQYTELHSLSFNAYLWELEGILSPHDGPDHGLSEMAQQAEKKWQRVK